MSNTEKKYIYEYKYTLSPKPNSIFQTNRIYTDMVSYLNKNFHLNLL